MKKKIAHNNGIAVNGTRVRDISTGDLATIFWHKDAPHWGIRYDDSEYENEIIAPEYLEIV